MVRTCAVVLLLAVFTSAVAVRADVVTDWNKTLYEVIQNDGTKPDNKANPGWATRSIAMVNGAVYDAFQAVNRTHRPFKANLQAPLEISLEAAVNQAAYELMLECYPSESALIDDAYNQRMAPNVIPDGAAKANGINLGHDIAQIYMAWRENDKADESVMYSPPAGLGKWEPDPYWPGLLENPPRPQEAWGPGWKNVATYGLAKQEVHNLIGQLDPIPELHSTDYAAAYDQVKELGALDSPMRSGEQEQIALFWAYDRPSMGPPPALFVRSLWEIAEAVGRPPEENARLFAQASIAMADAAVAAWDAKFEYNFWRPVTAIHQGGAGGEGDTDGNPDTIGDPNWRPLGAPGPIPDDGDPLTDADYLDDFTPPFPAWTSGHATMGAALFKSIQHFYGYNTFAEAAGLAPGTTYLLSSEEAGSGGSRQFTHFAHEGVFDLDHYAGSPDGENAISRIFLGIHWIFDQRDGMQLGHSIADYIDGNYFYQVPEPNAAMMAAFAALGLGRLRRRS